MKNDYTIIEDDEYSIDCECGHEDDFSEEEELEAGIKKKKKEKISKREQLLKTLRGYFDNVIFERREFFKHPEAAIVPNITGQVNGCYYYLVCQTFALSENKNPNIEYSTWLELKIRDQHEFVENILSQTVKHYKLLVKEESLDFFKEEDGTELSDTRVGLNSFILYDDRKLIPLPTVDEIIEKKKEVVRHVYQNGIFEEDNPRLGDFETYEMSSYMKGPDRMRQAMEHGISDIGLCGLFGCTIYSGIRESLTRYDGSEYIKYTYICGSLTSIHDPDNNTYYSYGYKYLSG